MMYIRIPLSLWQIEDLLHGRGIDICHETVRVWWNRFRPMFAAEFRNNRSTSLHAHIQWRWHLEKVFVRIDGAAYYVRRAVDYEGAVLEVFVTTTLTMNATSTAARFSSSTAPLSSPSGANFLRPEVRRMTGFRRPVFFSLTHPPAFFRRTEFLAGRGVGPRAGIFDVPGITRRLED